MKTIQISIDENLLASINNENGTSKSEVSKVIDEALRAWLKSKKANIFEREWINSLAKNADDATSAEDWLDAQAWSEK